MAVPIADDWKAIHDRMQQIRAEQTAFSRPCRACNGAGWMAGFRTLGTPKRLIMPFAGFAITQGICPRPGTSPADDKNLSGSEGRTFACTPPRVSTLLIPFRQGSPQF